MANTKQWKYTVKITVKNVARSRSKQVDDDELGHEHLQRRLTSEICVAALVSAKT